MNTLSIINIIIKTDDYYFRIGLQFIIKNFFYKKSQHVSFLESKKVDLLISHECAVPLKTEAKKIIIIERDKKAGLLKRVCTCRNIMFKHDTPEQFISALAKTMARAEAKAPCRVCRRKLTRREKEILFYLLAGLTASEISRRAGINVKSISQHKRNAMRKLSLTNTKELINWLHINKKNI